jgi:hypothetical protein
MLGQRACQVNNQEPNWLQNRNKTHPSIIYIRTLPSFANKVKIMLSLKKIPLSVLLLCLGLSGALSADDENSNPPYTLSVDEAYGRPFMSPGFAGSKDYGLGSGASFEYRCWNRLSLGVFYEHLAILAEPGVLIIDEIDLISRILPFGSGRLEPYILLKAGLGLSYNNLSGEAGTGSHLGVGFGTMYSLTQSFAMDFGLNYQSNTLSSTNLNYIYAHLGLQYRFGASKIAENAKNSSENDNLSNR